MTDFQKFLNGEYAKNLAGIEQGVTLKAHEARGRIITALGNDADEVLDELEAFHDDKAYHSYVRGYKDGVRFLMSIATS